MKLEPFAGIDNRSRDTELIRGGDAPRVYVRDAVNGDFTDQGHWAMRCGVRRVASAPLTDLWQSPVDGAVLARRGRDLVEASPGDWTVKTLAEIGDAELFYLPFNGETLIAGSRGIYRYANGEASRLQIDRAAAPWVNASDGGLTAGQYGVAVAWLAGQREGPLSEAAFLTLADPGAIQINLPPKPGPDITGYRLYLTPPNGGVFYCVEEGSGDSAVVSNDQTPGRQPLFQHMQPMPTGRYLQGWNGRLVVARGNALLFSQPLAYHIHDMRSDFVSLPQAVTFIAAVDGGLWVGQRDHVVFLSGNRPAEMQLVRKSASAPLPGSAVLLNSGEIGGELGSSGAGVAAWMSEKGYVLGMPDGSLAEVSADVLCGIHGNWGRTVAHGRRLLTIAR